MFEIVRSFGVVFDTVFLEPMGGIGAGSCHFAATAFYFIDSHLHQFLGNALTSEGVVNKGMVDTESIDASFGESYLGEDFIALCGIYTFKFGNEYHIFAPFWGMGSAYFGGCPFLYYYTLL